MNEIRLYVEGGGDKDSKGRLRIAFARFLSVVAKTAEEKGVRFRIILSGSRSDSFTNFRLALRDHTDSLSFLLVDAERRMTTSPREHLAQRPDSWVTSIADEDRYHLMVQVMEAWMLADPEALAAYYGEGFHASALPRTRNVEEIEKSRVMSSLRSATRGTSSHPETLNPAP